MDKNWKAVLVFLCIFLAGGVAGAFVGMRVACSKARNKPTPVVEGQQAPLHRPIDDWSKRKQKEFVARLELTSVQQTQTETLFQNAQAELRQVRERSFQQTAEITNRLETQIMELLSQEQRLKFTQLIKEREERQKKAAADRAAVSARYEHLPRPGELIPPPLAGKQPPFGVPVGLPPPPLSEKNPSPPSSTNAAPAPTYSPTEEPKP